MFRARDNGTPTYTTHVVLQLRLVDAPFVLSRDSGWITNLISTHQHTPKLERRCFKLYYQFVNAHIYIRISRLGYFPAHNIHIYVYIVHIQIFQHLPSPTFDDSFEYSYCYFSVPIRFSI